MKYALTFLLVLLLASTAQSVTLVSDLINKMRLRANETDSITSNFTNPNAVTFLDDAQSRIVTLGGLMERSYDTSYQRADSLGLVLPSYFRRVKDVKIFVGRQWEAINYNPGFQSPKDGYWFDIDWKNQDTAWFLVRGQIMQNTRIRISYFGVAKEISARTDTCRVRSDLIPFIIEEAYSYYLESLRMFGAAAQIQQRVRMDMGIKIEQEVKQ